MAAGAGCRGTARHGLCSAVRCDCPRSDLEPVLLRGTRELGGGARFATELVSFTQDDRGTAALVRGTESGESRTLRADYLLAADGPHSTVRERLGIGQTEPGVLFHRLSIAFRSRMLRKAMGEDYFVPCYVTDPAGQGVLQPVDDTQRWVFQLPWFPEKGQTPERFTTTPLRGKCGQPLRRPKHPYADRGYDHEVYRDNVRRFQITPHLARRGAGHGSGLGVYRWVVDGAEMACSMRQNALVAVEPAQPHSRDFSTSTSQPGPARQGASTWTEPRYTILTLWHSAPTMRR
ncbi:FAD-dependent monooxygenase [Streptomyces olivochromogenes]|uniref:FAD-dependent monooxygenase n=1 Tax=Streptomyces olivochromogenes TaxID=1963 RepID=UPI0035B2545C|nr:FAD-dependent monooxygenase [Streptomyces olivochromogenes]